MCPIQSTVFGQFSLAPWDLLDKEVVPGNPHPTRSPIQKCTHSGSGPTKMKGMPYKICNDCFTFSQDKVSVFQSRHKLLGVDLKKKKKMCSDSREAMKVVHSPSHILPSCAPLWWCRWRQSRSLTWDSCRSSEQPEWVQKKCDRKLLAPFLW